MTGVFWTAAWIIFFRLTDRILKCRRVISRPGTPAFCGGRSLNLPETRSSEKIYPVWKNPPEGQPPGRRKRRRLNTGTDRWTEDLSDTRTRRRWHGRSV